MVLITLSGLGLSGCGGSAEAAAPVDEPVLSQAYETCAADLDEALALTAEELRAGDFIELADQGSTVTLSTPVVEGDASRFAVLAGSCLMRESGAPHSVVSRLVRTATATTPDAERSWGRITLTWSHDAAGGVSAVLTEGA